MKMNSGVFAGLGVVLMIVATVAQHSMGLGHLLWLALWQLGAILLMPVVAIMIDRRLNPGACVEELEKADAGPAEISLARWRRVALVIGLILAMAVGV